MRRPDINKDLRLKAENLRQKKGFTVIEMVTVTIIISILTVIGGRTYFHEKNRFEYNDALNQILQLIKEARNSATTSRPITIETAPGVFETQIPPDGYGVYINLQPAANEPHLTLFASLGKGADGDTSILNQTFDKGIVTGPDDKADKILDRYTLPKHVNFEYMSFDLGDGFGLLPQWNPIAIPNPTPKATEAMIFFRPPLAEVYMGGLIGTATVPSSLETLELRFFNASAQAKTSPKKCQYVNLVRVKTFPTIRYTDCSEYNPNITY